MKESDFRIPQNSEKYITLQRTAYRSSLGKLFDKLKLGKFYNNNLSSIVERFRRRKIRKKYYQHIEKDYRDIKDFLPGESQSILDIGSGMAGIDVFLYKHYAESNPEIYLLDKQGKSNDIYYDLRSDAAYYNSFRLANQLLKLNGVPKKKVHTINITEKKFPHENNFDLVISLLAWGFHFPVSVYLEDAYSALSQNGKLIIDVRKESSGKQELNKKFNNVQVAADYEKYLRLVCYD